MGALTNTTRNYQLPDKKNRSKYIQKNFDEIASNYDLFNDLITFGLHRRWKNQVIKLCKIHKLTSGKVLDLCCGSGDLSIRLAKKRNNAVEVHCLDFSSEMLKILDARINKLPIHFQDNIHVHEGDATNLKTFKKSSVDAVTIGFGLRNVQNRKKCLQEIYRILKNNGRLVILDVGHVKSKFINFFHSIFFNSLVPIVGYILHRKKHEMYAYLPASAKIYPNQDVLKTELENVGFQNVEYKNKLFGASVIHIAHKI